MDPFAHPLVQSVLLPAAVAGVLLVLALVTRRAGLLAGVACLGVLLCLLSAMGAVPWPPRSGLHRLAWLLALASVMAPLLATGRVSARIASALQSAFVVLALVWLAWPKLASADGVALLFFVAGAAVALLVTARPGRGNRDPAAAAVMLGVGALCLVAVSLAASSLILAQLAGALGVVCAVLAARALWPSRGSASAALVLASGWGRVCLVLIAALVVLLTRAPGWPLLLLLPLVYADVPATGRVPCRWRPLAVAAMAMVPGLVMVSLILWLLGSGAAGDYYQG